MTFPKTTTMLAAAAALLIGIGPSFAQQGTTLAGPAQGQKADGSASTVPSAESGARGGAMSNGAMSGGAMKSGGMSNGMSNGTMQSGAATGSMSGAK